MVKYNTQDFRSVINYIKEKNKLSRAISFCNGIIRGVNAGLSGEQEAFDLKAKALSDKNYYIEQMDALKKVAQPFFARYGAQMKTTRPDYEVDGNK